MAEFYEAHPLLAEKSGKLRLIKTWYFRYMARKALHESRSIFVPTQVIKDEAVTLYGADPSKVIVTYEGVEDGLQHACEKEKQSKDILYVAGFYPHKGHEAAIDAVSYLCRNYDSSVRLFLRGNVPDLIYYEQMREYARTTRFPKNFFFVEYSSEASLDNIYGRGSVLLLLSEYEGFGLPLLEGQRCGLPVVCSDIPVFREILRDSAIFVDPKSVEQVARSLRTLLEDGELRRMLIQKGFENSARFSWETATGLVLSAYTSLTNSTVHKA
jgi:glycosyltransferase involved in cell wall biosynthesis